MPQKNFAEFSKSQEYKSRIPSLLKRSAWGIALIYAVIATLWTAEARQYVRVEGWWLVDELLKHSSTLISAIVVLVGIGLAVAVSYFRYRD